MNREYQTDTQGKKSRHFSQDRGIGLKHFLMLNLLFTLCTLSSTLPISMAETGLSLTVIQAWVKEGHHYAALGNYRKACRHYRKALSHEPSHREALLGLATSLSQQKKWSEAKIITVDLLTNHPDFPQAYYVHGLVLEAHGDMEGARQAFRTYIERNNGKLPASPKVHIKLHQMGLL